MLNFLNTCFEDLSSPELNFLMNGNNLAWCCNAYRTNKGNISGDIEREFYAQNPTDYYTKDVGTLLPSMFYAVAILGQDPVECHEKIDVTIWGAKDAAEYMRQFMHEELKPALKPRIPA